MKRILLITFILCLFTPVVNAVAPKDVSLYDMLPGYKNGEFDNKPTLKIYRIDDKDGHTAGRIIQTGSTKYIYDKNGKHIGSIREVN